MHFCSQVVDLPEPVTLDFLDAEVEDSNKQEVQTKTVTEPKIFPPWDSGSFRADLHELH